MNKYLFLAAAILSQNINAQVELTVVLNDNKQVISLHENQQETCTFDEMNITIQDIKEDEDVVILELTINEDTASTSQVTVEYGNNFVINSETNNLEISASKQ